MKIYFYILLALLLLIEGCGSSRTASYNYVQKQLHNSQIEFHNSLRIDEYINAFPQDWLVVPDDKEVTMRIDRLSRHVPNVGDNTTVQIAIKTRKPTDKERGEPLALSFVIDVSGSMDGEYLSDTKMALINSIKELNKGDIVSITTFNSTSETIASSISIDKASRKKLVKLVNDIEAGGGTNIETGLIAGYSEMSTFPAGITKRMLLLTDGRSQIDNKTPQQIALKAKVEYMEGARISTIGLGLGVNQDLLRKIAVEGNGHYYFADTSKTLTTILRDDLKSTIIPVAKDTKITLSLGAGYQLINLYGNPKSDNSKSTDLELGELNIDDWRIIIAELKRVSKRDATISVKGSYHSITQGKNKLLHTQNSSDSKTADINRNVLRNSVLFANASALVTASQLNLERKHDEALNILDLQINNNKVLYSITNSTIALSEIETLSKTRNLISENATSYAGRPSEWSDPVDTKSTHSGETKGLIIGGLKLASNVLPGLWSTVAMVLISTIE